MIVDYQYAFQYSTNFDVIDNGLSLDKQVFHGID
jgi:hypothetical protein